MYLEEVPDPAAAALLQRLRMAADLLGSGKDRLLPAAKPADPAAKPADPTAAGAQGDPPEDPKAALECPAEASSRLLAELIDALGGRPAPDRIWLLCAAVSGALPTAVEVIETRRMLEVGTDIECTAWLTDLALGPGGHAAAGRRIVAVEDRVFVDVDHSARNDLHTGIQQVVRRTVPLWMGDHPLLPVAWVAGGHALRPLSPAELERVRAAEHWEEPLPQATTVLPWRTVVVLPETPKEELCDRLAALARFSGNVVVVVGHDCIPLVSAALVPPVETLKSARYMSVVKHARRVACVSASAATEFRGFVQALAAQGLPGPEIVECLEPADFLTAPQRARLTRPEPPEPSAPPVKGLLPVVLSVGSLEPRKNQLGLLHAAERLWREGLSFELLLIGGSSWGEEIQGRVVELQEAGRPLQVLSKVDDLEVARAYGRARFVVFASLHEGFGLPVAEALSLGTPVITSDFGSTREIAEHGGALLVDPRDDQALVEAMRRLLTDEGALQQLRTEALGRPERTWETYARDLWSALVEPELAALHRRHLEGLGLEGQGLEGQGLEGQGLEGRRQ